MSVNIEGPYAPALLRSIANSRAQEVTSAVAAWAKEDLLLVHAARLNRIREEFISNIDGVVGAIEANRADRHP